MLCFFRALARFLRQENSQVNDEGVADAGQDVLLIGYTLHLIQPQHICLLQRLQRQELPSRPAAHQPHPPK